MERAHPCARRAEQYAHLVAQFHFTAQRRAGHDQSRAGDGEAAIDAQAEVAAALSVERRSRRVLQVLAQRLDALAGHR